MVRNSRAVSASILGGLWEPGGPWGAATSGQANTVTTTWWRLVCRHGERISMCVRKDQPHHRWWPRGDTSHSSPAPCDVALEVCWGQTGSPGCYPVLSARLRVKCQDTKKLRNPKSSCREHPNPSLLPPPRPVDPTSSVSSWLLQPHNPCQRGLLTLGPQPFQTDLKPPSYIQVWLCLKASIGPAAFRPKLAVPSARP